MFETDGFAVFLQELDRRLLEHEYTTNSLGASDLGPYRKIIDEYLVIRPFRDSQLIKALEFLVLTKTLDPRLVACTIRSLAAMNPASVRIGLEELFVPKSNPPLIAKGYGFRLGEIGDLLSLEALELVCFSEVAGILRLGAFAGLRLHRFVEIKPLLERGLEDQDPLVRDFCDLSLRPENQRRTSYEIKSEVFRANVDYLRKGSRPLD